MNILKQKDTTHIIDVTDKILGRVATEIATILQGKKNPAYNPRNVGNDRVIIKNASRMKVSGNKETKKIYYKHTGYMGHLKEMSYERLFAKSPARVIEKAVFNMLPKNRLRQIRMNRLSIES